MTLPVYIPPVTNYFFFCCFWVLQKIDDKLDLTKVGMGAVRSKRFAMVVEDMKVIYIGVETQYVYLLSFSLTF